MYHQNPEAFWLHSAEYGPIGWAMVQLSNLEFAHDRFVLAYLKVHSAQAVKISKSFPRQYKDKINFLIHAVSSTPSLKRIPILDDGSQNLLWLQYQLDEIYDVRTVLAHGSIFYSESLDGGKLWRFDRITAVQGKKSTWKETSVEIGSAFLADVAKTAYLLKHYLNLLQLTLEGQFDWEQNYIDDKEIRKNNLYVKELVDFEIVSPEALFGFPEDDGDD